MENMEKRNLPLGMGYKSCWMVVEGATQKDVMSAFLQGRKMKYPYMEGLEKVEKAKAKDKKLMVTGTHKKQNYVIGDAIGEFFYKTEEFLEKCKEFSRVYVYMTHRVSETHGFALIEHGELIRLFYYDENEIKNIGEPLPEELALGYRLPKTFEEEWDEEGNFTLVYEDVIVSLAIQQVGIDVEQYPYKEVRVGKMFEYAADLSADPYPEDEDYDYDEIPEEVMNLPEVQRFLNTETPEEKLAIAEELKDVMTHSMINAFGEIVATRPSYNRLSERYEELLGMIRLSIRMKSISMDQEKLSKQLSEKNYVFKGKIFSDVIFENIECEQLIFEDCSFWNCQFLENQIEWIEIKECGFYDSLFSGKLENVLLNMERGRFNRCKIHDFEFLGYDEQSEILNSTFENCSFSNINIKADLTMSGGWIEDSTGEKVECIMNSMFEVKFRDDKFQNVNINMAIIKNSFRDVEIQKFQNIDLGEEPVCRGNVFENCYLNNEPRNQ